MRVSESIATMTLAVCLLAASVPLNGDELMTPIVELQSWPLTPPLVLNESPRPIHQIRLVVDANLKSGKLILDGNSPEFNEFGDLVSGLESPHVRNNGDAKLIKELACSIELIKEGPDKWRLYRIEVGALRSSYRVATRGSIADGGPARVMILGADDKVTTVVECVRYGLAVP